MDFFSRLLLFQLQLFQLLEQREAAQRAAPSSPAFSFVTTCTGMASIRGCNRPFARKAFMNRGPVSLLRILGEMPPARNNPPVAITFRARLAASAP